MLDYNVHNAMEREEVQRVLAQFAEEDWEFVEPEEKVRPMFIRQDMIETYVEEEYVGGSGQYEAYADDALEYNAWEVFALGA